MGFRARITNVAATKEPGKDKISVAWQFESDRVPDGPSLGTDEKLYNLNQWPLPTLAADIAASIVTFAAKNKSIKAEKDAFDKYSYGQLIGTTYT